MSTETVLFALLAADAAVDALIADRIYPEVAPQDTSRPYVVYQRESTQPLYTIHGTLALQSVFMSLTCYAATRASAEDIADAVVVALAASTFELLDRTGGYDPDLLVHFVALRIVHRT